MKTFVKHNRTRALVAGIAAAGLIAAAGCAQRTERAAASSGSTRTVPAGASASATQSGAAFASEAAVSNMTEIELGRLAADKGSSDAVREFGRMMVNDHQDALDQLQEVARSQGYSLPSSLPADRRATITRLRALQGADFDREFMATMVNAHQRAVQTFENYSFAQQGARTDDALASYARNTLPTLREHLSHAQAVAQRVGAAYSTPSSYRSGQPTGSSSVTPADRYQGQTPRR